MKIYQHNAVALLYERMKSMEGSHASWRCIHLNLSERDEHYSSSLRQHFIVDALQNLLSDMDGAIYLCHDGDIVVLFQGAAKPVLARLGTHFEDIHGSGGIFSLFDLSVSWQDFAYLCSYKFFKLVLALKRIPAPFPGFALGREALLDNLGA